MEKETTTTATTTTTQDAQETAKELTFFEAVKVLLADDIAKGGFEIVKIKNYWGQFRSTWEDESGLHLHTILVYKNQWGKGFDVVRKDEITRETHYMHYKCIEEYADVTLIDNVTKEVLNTTDRLYKEGE